MLAAFIGNYNTVNVMMWMMVILIMASLMMWMPRIVQDWKGGSKTINLNTSVIFVCDTKTCIPTEIGVLKHLVTLGAMNANVSGMLSYIALSPSVSGPW